MTNGNEATDLFQGAGGGPLISPATGLAPSIYRPDPRLATPYSQQTSLGAEYLIAPDLTASVNYLFVRGVKLSRTRNGNPLPQTGPVGQQPNVLCLRLLATRGIWNSPLDNSAV